MKLAKFSRRKFLQSTVGIGCGLLIPGLAAAANVHEISGKVFINNLPATLNSTIRSGDLITTSHTGSISFSIDGDAFLVKERSSIQVGTKGSAAINLLHLLTGQLLGVFEKGRKREIVTATATIGIRGTACFLNVESKSTYFCTCYGSTEIRAENLKEKIEATHHNAHQIIFDGMHVMGMEAMEVIDHTDNELRELESYVGRIPLFDQ